MKNDLYWTYNLPMQMFPIHQDEEDSKSPVIDYSIVNYMPRKASCATFNLSEVLEDQTHEEFCEAAAAHLEHLAKLFRQIGRKEIEHIYYPDNGMDKSNLP